MTMNVVTPARSSVARSVRRSAKPKKRASEPAMCRAGVYLRRASGGGPPSRAPGRRPAGRGAGSSADPRGTAATRARRPRRPARDRRGGRRRSRTAEASCPGHRQAPCQREHRQKYPIFLGTGRRDARPRVSERVTAVPLTETFWSPAELLEVHGSLLDERVPALHRLLGLVVEVEGGVGELRHPGTLLGVDVERLLGEGESRRALVEELPAPLLDLGPEVPEGHHLVDEPHGERLLRRVLAAEVPDLPRLLLAHEARQVARAVPGVHAAHPGARLAEDRVLRGDREVAEDVEDVPAADRKAVDHGDHRLWDVPDRAVERLHVHGPLDLGASGARRVAALTALLLVAARAECLVARARQHHHADGRVPARVRERLGQLGDGPRAERVAHLGPVDRDPGDAVPLLVVDVRVRHDVSVPLAGRFQEPSRASRRRGWKTASRLSCQARLASSISQDAMQSFCERTTSSIIARGSRWNDSWRRRFACAFAVGDAACALAMISASVRSSSAGGLTSSFKSVSSFARPTPTTRASRRIAPSGMSPWRVAPRPRTASSVARRRSQASASWRPPPIEWPCRTASETFGMSSRWLSARIQWR